MAILTSPYPKGEVAVTSSASGIVANNTEDGSFRSVLANEVMLHHLIADQRFLPYNRVRRFVKLLNTSGPLPSA